MCLSGLSVYSRYSKKMRSQVPLEIGSENYDLVYIQNTLKKAKLNRIAPLLRETINGAVILYRVKRQNTPPLFSTEYLRKNQFRLEYVFQDTYIHLPKARTTPEQYRLKELTVMLGKFSEFVWNKNHKN